MRISTFQSVECAISNVSPFFSEDTFSHDTALPKMLPINIKKPVTFMLQASSLSIFQAARLPADNILRDMSR